MGTSIKKGREKEKRFPESPDTCIYLLADSPLTLRARQPSCLYRGIRRVPVVFPGVSWRRWRLVDFRLEVLTLKVTRVERRVPKRGGLERQRLEWRRLELGDRQY